MVGLLGFGLTALVPAGVLLAISYYVLVANDKVEKESIKAFGRVVIVILWISTALVVSVGLYGLGAGRPPMMRGAHQRGITMPKSSGDLMRDQMRQEMQHEMMNK
jgi:hypothetical protein